MLDLATRTANTANVPAIRANTAPDVLIAIRAEARADDVRARLARNAAQDLGIRVLVAITEAAAIETAAIREDAEGLAYHLGG